MTLDAPARPGVNLPDTVRDQLAGLGPREVVIGLLTYNNARTVGTVVEAARLGLEKHVPGVPAAIVHGDAGSSDSTVDLVVAAPLPVVGFRHHAAPSERSAVPLGGVPGREEGLRLAFGVARTLSARVLVLLEADVTSITHEWIDRLVRPVLDGGGDLVLPVHDRHRYDGTVTTLILAPLARALWGRRVHQPLGGPRALSARLLEHLLAGPVWPTSPHLGDFWILGAATARGFALSEARLGPRRVASQTRPGDLPTVLAQSLGGLFTVMDRWESLWLDVRGSEPVPVAGEAAPPDTPPPAVAVDRMLVAFRRGVRDLTTIWEHILAPETLAEVLGLDTGGPEDFRFPDDLWARVVYEFALGHRFRVVHREHLLRSLVPLYLGRAAAFVAATRAGSDAAVAAARERVGASFERRKPYLVERWP
ncbi:MAG: hypothetical protein HY727_02690 [Candidatus Rokubacteria bacterium]|nr:hypothetical protein [Candidatus Rokubacteria bacterium]